MYDSDDCVEVDAPTHLHKKQRHETSCAGPSTASSSAADAADCVVTGTAGDNPFIDFVHARWYCCAFPIKNYPPATFCPKCYCAVCDIPASKCTRWSEHCSADPLDPEVLKQCALSQATNAFAADKCSLGQLKQVYPTESDVELKDVNLKPYQRQVGAASPCLSPSSLHAHVLRSPFTVHQLDAKK